MIGFVNLLCLVFVTSALVQVFLTLGFVRRLKRWQVPLLNDVSCPSSIVILCLRGSDPYLSNCLSGLLNQDYPNYGVRFVVDHASDPALAVLQESVSSHPFSNYAIEFLESPQTTCSLKCSSLAQAIRGVPDSVEFIALLDADTIPHPGWLRELATALQPIDVGAVSGNRWYMPCHCSTGAMIRYVWNAAAVVQMYWYKIAWGGSLAVKMDSIRRADLIHHWQHALCEDTMLKSKLAGIEQKIEFVPSLMMINEEDCSVRSFLQWVRRQLLTAKLYHPAWIAVVANGVLSVLIVALGLVTLVVLMSISDWRSTGWLLVTMLSYQTIVSLLLPWIHTNVVATLRDRGHFKNWAPNLRWYHYAWYIWLTQWVYSWALLSVSNLRVFEWRKIHYRVIGPWKIKMLGYRPYNESQNGSHHGETSL